MSQTSSQATSPSSSSPHAAAATTAPSTPFHRPTWHAYTCRCCARTSSFTEMESLCYRKDGTFARCPGCNVLVEAIKGRWYRALKPRFAEYFAKAREEARRNPVVEGVGA